MALAIEREWLGSARLAQYPLGAIFDSWLVMGGRGAGKTRLGAEWVNALVRGLPPFSGGRRYGRLALIGETLTDAREVMVEGPSGVLVYAPKEGGSLSDDQFDRLNVELEQGYAGAARAGRPLLLEGGLDWRAMSLSPRDMDFMAAKNGAARDIALALGVPPMLLGIPGDNTYANYQEANRAFYRLTVLPLVGRVAKEFSAWLQPVFGAGVRLWYDADGIEGLAAEREALWSRVGAADFLSDEEKRRAVGYGPRGE